MSHPGSPRDPLVQNMFDRIAGRYDLLNRVISFRLDRRWRRKAIEALLRDGHEVLLDLGTGTGDLTFAAAEFLKEDGKVLGLDFSFRMLSLARRKGERTLNSDKIHFIQGSALAPPFRDGSFDGVMTAFVLRNISDLRLFFEQAFRVLKPGGKLVSLDMFPPPQGLFSSFYNVYFHRVMPWVGGLLARDRSAYQYLSDTVRKFDPPEAITEMIRRCGFDRILCRRFLGGAVALHVAEKPPSS